MEYDMPMLLNVVHPPEGGYSSVPADVDNEGLGKDMFTMYPPPSGTRFSTNETGSVLFVLVIL